MLYNETSSIRLKPTNITLYHLLTTKKYAGKQNVTPATVLARSRDPESHELRIRISHKTVMFISDTPVPPYPNAEMFSGHRWNINFVALRLGVKERTVLAWAEQGKFDAYRIGPGTYEVDVETFHNFINKRYYEQNDVSAS